MMDKRVLIVDDDPDVVKLLAKLLRNDGYEPLTAADGVQALKVVLAEAPPIVLTDWMMPNMDGIQLCSELRRHEGVGFVYIVILTAKTNEKAIVTAMEAGADDFLYKPVKQQELLLRLRSGYRIGQLQCDLAKRNREVHLHNARLAVTTDELEEANLKLSRMATTDELTGLTNRREAMNLLNIEWARSDRYREPLACVILDIDHFKNFNDTHGHAVGDLVLRATADTLAATTRTDERVCRVGGEEFLVICPKSDHLMAATAAERMRAAVASAKVTHAAQNLRVTVSLGLAQRTPYMSTPDDLLNAADQALYRAKAQGRNRVCVMEQIDSGRKLACPFATSEQETPEAGVAHELAGETATILVVDPDETIRSRCRDLLEREGHNVREAADGARALSAMHREPADVVVIEWTTPDIDGLECTRRLKADPTTRDTAVMVVAAACEESAAVVEALDAGADHFMSKPFDADEFVRRVRAMVEVQLGRKALLNSNAVRAEQARAFELLLEYSREIASAETLDAVLDTTIAVTAQLTCSRRISIMLPDDDGKHLTIARAIGMSEETMRSVRLPVGDGTAGKAFQQGETVVCNEPNAQAMRKDRYESSVFVSAPLVQAHEKTEEHIVGVLNITGRNVGESFAPLELECIDMICNIAASAIDNMTTRQARNQARDSVVFALAKLAENRDNDTGRHLERVTRFAVMLAEDLGRTARFRDEIDGEFLRNLERAVPLHDIGKVAIPDNILFKPGKLTPEETAVMRTHVAVGTATINSVLDRVPGVRFLKMAADVTSGHHEWYNGDGYPARLAGDAIPLSARIVALADVYDALTTCRPYKSAFSHEKAMAIILDLSAKQFDPTVIDAFLRNEKQFEQLAASLADDVPSVSDVPEHLPYKTPEPQALACANVGAD